MAKPTCGAREIACLKSLLSDLKPGYLRTIAEQRKIVELSPGTPKAAEAALKIAVTTQTIGTRQEAISAYESVIKDYPLTRPGWKAVQEATWLRQKMPGEFKLKATAQSPGGSRDIENAQSALREKRLGDAERTARKLLSSADHKDRTAALELLIRATAAKSGPKDAAKQAWEMASGSTDFKPVYSDVLRLEAIAADLEDRDADSSKAVAERKDKRSIDEGAVASNAGTSETGESGSARKSSPARPNVQASASRRSTGFGGFSPPVAWPGASPGGSSVSPGARNVKPVQPKPTTPPSTQPSPVAPAPAQPTPEQPQPVAPTPEPIVPPEPEKPALDRWTCDSQLREVEGDEQAVRDLMRVHLTEAAKILFWHTTESKNVINERRRAVGIALTAVIWASSMLNDDELAARICKDYLMPNLDAARPERWDYLSQETVLINVISVWQRTGEVDKVIDLYKWWITWDPCANSADANRIRLAEVLVGEERYEEAISYLQQIDDKGDCAAGKLLIPDMELKLKEQRSKGGSNGNGVRGQR
ncbi:MAG: hypothetical protein M1133_09280 [Armatimonadetes bacterium]|nr:hypothetical protein [Armatimonadota bacterium]